MGAIQLITKGRGLIGSLKLIEDLEMNGPIVNAYGAGSSPVASIVPTERGDGYYHQTLLTVTNLSIATVDAGAAGAQGSQKIYDFPTGVIQMLGAVMNLTTLAGAGGITDTAALVGAIGSVAASAADATLTSTEADIIASFAGTLIGGAGVLTKLAGLIATPFDGHTTPLDAFLNIAVPDAGSASNDTVTVNGSILLSWLNLGTF